MNPTATEETVSTEQAQRIEEYLDELSEKTVSESPTLLKIIEKLQLDRELVKEIVKSGIIAAAKSFDANNKN